MHLHICKGVVSPRFRRNPLGCRLNEAQVCCRVDSCARGAFNLDDDCLDGTISRGLELLHYTLFKTKDHAHLVSTMQEGIIKNSNNYFMNNELDDATESLRHQDLYNLEKYWRGPSPFQSDE